MKNLPYVTFVIPTLNTDLTLEKCLKSIFSQDYSKDKIEIIISDGGSTDNTIELAKKYGTKIVENKLKTGEAGKMVGVKNAKGEFIALVDSDNILPSEHWLKEMVQPLIDCPEAVGSEPWEYTWRKEDGFITRYCAMIGMNDPLVHFLGNYDRLNILTGKWTEVIHNAKDCEKYLLVTLSKEGIPTIGANGTIFRYSFLKKHIRGNYLFDIDIIAREISEKGTIRFIKVKNGIIHTFCESSIKKFARKQRRRAKDFLFHKWVANDREFDWYKKDIFGKDPWGIIKFIIYCITFVPLILQSIRGYIKKQDIAWFFHPLACEITLWEYGWGRIFGIYKKEEIDRERWSQ